MAARHFALTRQARLVRVPLWALMTAGISGCVLLMARPDVVAAANVQVKAGAAEHTYAALQARFRQLGFRHYNAAKYIHGKQFQSDGYDLKEYHDRSNFYELTILMWLDKAHDKIRFDITELDTVDGKPGAPAGKLSERTCRTLHGLLQAAKTLKGVDAVAEPAFIEHPDPFTVPSPDQKRHPACL